MVKERWRCIYGVSKHFLYLIFKLFIQFIKLFQKVTPDALSLSHSDFCYQHFHLGSLAGAAHSLKNNASVQRKAQKGQKPFVEYKNKSFFDFDFQY